MCRRKIFKETFPHAVELPFPHTENTSARMVLRTHVEFFFGIEEIVRGLVDRAFTLDRPEQLLTIKRTQALRMTRDAFQAQGYRLQQTDPHELLLTPKSITPKRFVGKLTDHIRKLFPELVW